MTTQDPDCPACSMPLYSADLEMAEDALGYNAPDLGSVAKEVKQTGLRHFRMVSGLAKAMVSRASYGHPTVLCCSLCSRYFAWCRELRCTGFWQLEGAPKLYEPLVCPSCGVHGAATMDPD